MGQQAAFMPSTSEQWTTNCLRGGKLRKQFAQWRVPVPIINSLRLKEGNECQISVQLREYEHTGLYTLSSNREFRFPKKVSEGLRSNANADPSSSISFGIIKGISFEVAEQELADSAAESLRLSSFERQNRLSTAEKLPRKMLVRVSIFVRNPDVIAEGQVRAKGIREFCKTEAPFRRATDGSPYLEVHHKVRLADGGEDTVSHALAWCRNCHRRVHYG